MKQNQEMIDHILETVNFQFLSDPELTLLLSGDVNDLDVNQILRSDKSLTQIVKVPTRGDKTLDVIITNAPDLFSSPVSVPPLHPDTAGKGEPSDHRGVFASSSNVRDKTGERSETKSVKIRPLPQSKFDTFGRILGNESWSYLDSRLDSSHLVELFEQHLEKISDIVFPTKIIKIQPNDKPYYTEELRTLKRLKLREYEKHGKSQKFSHLHQKYENMLVCQIKKYKYKLIQEVKDGKKGSIYKYIRRLGNGPSDSQFKSFNLPSFVEQNLSPLESAQRISDFFVAISQEFSPLRLDNLSSQVIKYLMHEQDEHIPLITDHYVYQKLKMSKKPHSSVKGDVHPNLIKHFGVELTAPITKIFNQITVSQRYPSQWKIEYGVPIPKKYPPESMEELRVISKTPFFSKLYEFILVECVGIYISVHTTDL